MAGSWLTDLLDPPAMRERNALLSPQPTAATPSPPVTAGQMVTWMAVTIAIVFGAIIAICVGFVIFLAVAMSIGKQTWIHAGDPSPTSDVVVVAAAPQVGPYQVILPLA